MFGSGLSIPPGYSIPDIGALPSYSSGINAALAANAAKPSKKGGFGGFLRAFAGYLGDNLSGNNVYATSRLEQQKLEEAQREAEAKRAADMQDYIAQKAIDAQYKTQEPHYFQDNAGNQMAIGPDGKPYEVYHDPLQMKFIPNGLGGVVPVPLSQFMGGGNTPQSTPLSDDDIRKMMQGGQSGSAPTGGF